MNTPTFKEIMQRDVKQTFLNTEEFADDTHTIDGNPMVVMFDDMEHVEREKKMKSTMDGIYARQILIFVSASEFGPLPAFGRLLNLDGKKYTVIDATDEGGMYAITLEANKSR